MINKILISIAALTFALPAVAMSKKPAATDAPTAQKSPAVDGVWIGKSDQAVACAKERGVDLDVMANQLKEAGVQVLAKKKLHDSKMRIQMCGIDKGDMNGYFIAKADLPKAKTKDFIVVESVPDNP